MSRCVLGSRSAILATTAKSDNLIGDIYVAKERISREGEKMIRSAEYFFSRIDSDENPNTTGRTK